MARVPAQQCQQGLNCSILLHCTNQTYFFILMLFGSAATITNNKTTFKNNKQKEGKVAAMLMSERITRCLQHTFSCTLLDTTRTHEPLLQQEWLGKRALGSLGLLVGWQEKR